MKKEITLKNDLVWAVVENNEEKSTIRIKGLKLRMKNGTWKVFNLNCEPQIIVDTIWESLREISWHKGLNLF